MKNVKNTLFVALLAFAGTSCIIDRPCINPNNNQITETQSFYQVNQLNLNIPVDFILIQDSSQNGMEVQVTGPSNMVKNIKLKQKEDELTIKDERCINSYKNIEIEIRFNKLEELNLNGSGNISVYSAIKLPILEVDVNGSGNINLDVETKELETNINGSGNIYLSGTTNNLEAYINGSGDIDAFDLAAVNADVNINGSGKCKVWALDFLTIEISGSGDVWYIGNPNVNSSITGSGSVKNLN